MKMTYKKLFSQEEFNNMTLDIINLAENHLSADNKLTLRDARVLIICTIDEMSKRNIIKYPRFPWRNHDT